MDELKKNQKLVKKRIEADKALLLEHLKKRRLCSLPTKKPA